MFTYIRSLLPILLIMCTLIGCALLQKENANGQLPIDPPLSVGPTTNNGTGEQSQEPSEIHDSDHKNPVLDWQIELRGDPGVHLNSHTTHLPAEKLVFTATFTQEMDHTSVVEAFQKNLINNDFPDKSDYVPTLDFKWLNPLQVEITFNGADITTPNRRYTLSAHGASNKDGSSQLTEDKFLSFDIYPNQSVYSIDQSGKLSKTIVKIPYSLFPLSQSPDGEQLILGRANYLETDAGYLPYLFDIQSKKILKIFPTSYVNPFWGNDHKLYTLNENSLVRLGDEEEQWVEFGEYPYIHGWSISPDQKYEIYLLSKDLDPTKTKVSIMVKDLNTNQTETYEDLVPMNDLNPINSTIMHYKIQWINSNKQVYLETFSDYGDRKDYIFDLKGKEVFVAPEFLQVESSYSSGAPKWSMDQQYVATNAYEKQSGIYDADGKLLYEWNPSYPPQGTLYWNPNKHIVAYKTATAEAYYVVQYDLDRGEIILTEGDFKILGWTDNGTSLQVSK